VAIASRVSLAGDAYGCLSVGMDPQGIISALLAGVVIGLIARILVPSMQPIGCIVTILIGIIGAFVGLGAGQAFGYGDNFWLVLITQIFVATILVAITAALFRGARGGSGG
jgi:uncharacterized membrane protein YeaQ/YmgE (transglycosylase-associated protein family)